MFVAADELLTAGLIIFNEMCCVRSSRYYTTWFCFVRGESKRSLLEIWAETELLKPAILFIRFSLRLNLQLPIGMICCCKAM